LAGLAGTTGYKGFSALGQGAMSAVDAARQRQATQIAPIQAGQQYQAGQQQLLQGNLQLGQTLAQFNIMQKHFAPNAPELTMADLQDPQTLAHVISTVANQAMAGAGVAPSASAAAPQGAPQQQQGQPSDYATRTAFLESNNGQSSDNIYQFKGDTATRYGYHPGMSVDDQNKAFAQFTADNYATLSGNLGRPPTSAELYLAHQQGAAGALALMGNPNASAVDALMPAYGGDRAMATRAITDNGGTADMKAGDFVQHWAQAYANAGGQGTGGTQVAQSAPPGPSPEQVQAAEKIYAQGHLGMGFDQGRQYGAGLLVGGNPQGQKFIDDANAMDPRVQYAQAYTKAQAAAAATPSRYTPGSEAVTGTGQIIGEVPELRTILDPGGSGNMVYANVYPSGRIQVIGPTSGKTAGGAGAAELGPGAAEEQKVWVQRKAELGAAVNGNIAAEQRLNAMAQAFKLTPSGTLAGVKADAAALLKAVGIKPPANLGDPAAAQQILHDNVLAVFSMIKPFVGGRVAQAEINRLADALPNIGLQPEANLSILAQLQGLIKYNRDLYHALSQASKTGPVDPNDFEIGFNEKHPLQGYVDKAQGNIGTLAGGQTSAAAAPPPKKGDVQISNGQKWVFNGGDPSKPDNWSLVSP
jgi:hypothetical protein